MKYSRITALIVLTTVLINFSKTSLTLCNELPLAEPNVFQAEDALLFGSFARTQYSGYTGSGYIDLADRTGSYLEFVFICDNAETDNVTVYYANGGSNRTIDITLNDALVKSISFKSTGSWASWSSIDIPVLLQADINRLRFTSTTNNVNPNFDRIFINGQGAVPVYKLTLLKSGAGNVSASLKDTYFEAGTQVTLTAEPDNGNTFYRWGGDVNNYSNPYNLKMDSHKTVVGIMMDTTGIGTFPYESSPQGFASVHALGFDGTTGGSGTEAGVVYVTNSTDFKALMYNRVDTDHTRALPPLTVYIIGTFVEEGDVGLMIDVKDAYDISVIGVGNDAVFSGVGLKIVRSSNIIVRNILFKNAYDDGISVQADDDETTGNHIWIDHCSFTNGHDGALDVTHTASYVTISWNHFYDHDKTCLMGHSNSQTSDTSMKVTYHHNFFDGTIQRHPRVRSGKAHVYNNYYLANQLYGISSNNEADVLVEGNYFKDLSIPTETSRDSNPPGDLVERYNYYDNCGTPGIRGNAFEASDFYAFTFDTATEIPQMLVNYAGSGIYDFSIGDTTSVTSVEQSNSSIPVEFELSQNYPNPFNPTTKIKYTINPPDLLKGEAEVETSFLSASDGMKFLKLRIYDVLGNTIATIVNQEQAAGNYEVEFNAGKFPSGVYFYRLQTGGYTKTMKMLLLK